MNVSYLCFVCLLYLCKFTQQNKKNKYFLLKLTVIGFINYCLSISILWKLVNIWGFVPFFYLIALNYPILVKVNDEKRQYKQTLGGIITKKIRRTKYLMICWMCGSPYESFKSNSYACSPRCSNNIQYARKNGFNAPANMEELTKAKNVKGVKGELGYL